MYTEQNLENRGRFLESREYPQIYDILESVKIFDKHEPGVARFTIVQSVLRAGSVIHHSVVADAKVGW